MCRFQNKCLCSRNWILNMQYIFALKTKCIDFKTNISVQKQLACNAFRIENICFFKTSFQNKYLAFFCCIENKMFRFQNKYFPSETLFLDIPCNITVFDQHMSWSLNLSHSKMKYLDLKTTSWFQNKLEHVLIQN